MKELFQEFNDFYPEYLQAHSDKGNQVLHFIGASVFIFLLGKGIWEFSIYYILAAVFIGYLLPGIGHRFFQKNDSFRSSKPILCVIGAARLYFDTLTFQIAKKMKKTVYVFALLFISLQVFAQDSTKIRDNRYVDVPAEFKGGAQKFVQWYLSNIKYPNEAREQNIQGKVIAQLTIDENGKVTDCVIKSNTHKMLNEEVLHSIKKIPNFEPAQHERKKVKVYYDFTATFIM